MSATPEVWLRGPLANVPPLLQPVAHSLHQSLEEVRALAAFTTRTQLWTEPGDAPTAGFHLQHAAGSLDRLTTYARGEQLSRAQLDDLARETALDSSRMEPAALANAFAHVVERALEQIAATDANTLLHARDVGRGKLPSTVIGLLVHAAEHTQRHIGQLTTTLTIVRRRSTAPTPRDA